MQTRLTSLPLLRAGLAIAGAATIAAFLFGATVLVAETIV